MEPYTFEFGEKDAYGCTHIDKYTFKQELGLTHSKPLIIQRVDGTRHKVDAIKCTSNGQTFYQIDLTELGTLRDALVTIWPSEDGDNEVLMTILHPPHAMWKRGGVVDAIVDLQRRLSEIEDCLESDQ